MMDSKLFESKTKEEQIIFGDKRVEGSVWVERGKRSLDNASMII
jgi:hypothetical protein